MRLIDGDALQAEHVATYGKRLLLIDTAPTIAQPEIIQCRDCKWWKDGDCLNIRGLYHPKGEGFCSMAERKDT